MSSTCTGTIIVLEQQNGTITISSIRTTIPKFESETVSVSCKDSSGVTIPCNNIQWFISDFNVLYHLGNNVFFANAVGQSTIYCTSNSLTSNTLTINVTSSSIGTVTISSSRTTIPKSETETISVSCKDSSGVTIPCNNIQWFISDENILEPLGNNAFYAVDMGQVTVYCISNSLTSNTLTINVTDPAYIESNMSGCVFPAYVLPGSEYNIGAQITPGTKSEYYRLDMSGTIIASSKAILINPGNYAVYQFTFPPIPSEITSGTIYDLICALVKAV